MTYAKKQNWRRGMKSKLAYMTAFFGLIGVLEAASYGGKSYSLGGGGGGYQTTFGGNGNYVEDPDNPNELAQLLESKNTKARRLSRVAIKENIAYLYSQVIPKYEQNIWSESKNNVDTDGRFGEITWKHLADSTFRIEYKNILVNGKPQYVNISDFVNSYKNELQSHGKFKYVFSEVKISSNSALIEFDEFERALCDQVKKNTQVKFIEKWILSGNWLIKISYSLCTSGDEEKNASWNELEKSWEERLSRIEFHDESSQ